MAITRIGWTHFRRLSALASLLLITGCAGSSWGDRFGKSLEADPQLVNENPNAVVVQPADSPDKSTSRSANSSSGSTSSPPQNAPKDPVEKSKVAVASKQVEPTVVAGDYVDIDKAPEELQPYLVDLIELDLLQGQPQIKSADGKTQNAPADEFRPNQAITRREYAQWLLSTNNRFYTDQRSRKIRAGVDSSQPVFKDVSASAPDFGAIQGLAEAGIIPSPLTGSSTELTFRPDAPLTRKDLILWKVPLDTRAPLPQATPDAVEQAWGFQDVAKIPARALQAVLADYQNGDLSNIRRAFGYTTLFQPDKAATRAETAAVLWRYGNSTEGVTAEELRNPRAAQNDSEQQGGQQNNQQNNQPRESRQ